MSLTDMQIRKLKAPDSGQKTYFDDALPGFGVRISQGGSKTFIVLCGRERRRKTLGRYPELSLADARNHAKQAQLNYLHETHSPSTISVTFYEARDAFLADCNRRNKASTADEYRRLLQKHFTFARDLTSVTKREVSAAIDRLADTPSEQKHAFVAIRTMMNWCLRRGWIEVSPIPPLSFPVTTRTRVLSDEELVAVWSRAKEHGYPFGSIVQLLILTGQRRGEIAGLRYSWIDGNYITFPAGFTKNKREHVVPIGSMALEMLECFPPVADLVFPARGREDVAFSGWSKSKPRFDKDLKVAPYTLHDLRRTFSSNMARLGTQIHVTEKLLNHVSGTISGVAAVYNRHSYRNEMRAAIDAYEAFLADLITMNES